MAGFVEEIFFINVHYSKLQELIINSEGQSIAPCNNWTLTGTQLTLMG